MSINRHPALDVRTRCSGSLRRTVVAISSLFLLNEKAHLLMRRALGSAPRRTRTYNPLIKSQLLCQLS